jgi:protein TonB
MWKLLACTVAQIVLLAGIGYGQAGSPVELPKDPRALLKAATPYYDFNSPDLKPWHLKASYQFYDSKGNPAEQGRWEYWWASPKVHRSTWTRNNATQTEWLTAEVRYRKQDGGSLRYFERHLSNILLDPLPSETAVDSGRMKLDLKMTPVGQMQLACVSAILQWENNGKLEAPPSARPEFYCFSPSLPILRLVYNNALTYEYNQLAKTQNRYLAKQVFVMNGNRKVFSIAIDEVDRITATDPALARPSDATLVSASIPEDVGNNNKSGVGGGSLLKKPQPVYPYISKMAHEQGTVVLAAVIGTDGRISDLETLSSPSPMLAKSAEEAVKKWEYKPYLLNSKPVEVETIVNVIFALGR